MADRYHGGMIDRFPGLSRRNFLFTALAGGLVGCGRRASGQSPLDTAREVVSARDFGAVSAPGRDNSAALQRALDALASRGGGVLHLTETYECGNLVVPGDGITVYGPGAWLVNGRITVPAGCSGFRLDGLGLLDRRGDDSAYLLDVSGRDATFSNVSLVKDPIAGGYQMYLRQSSNGCRFNGLRLRGSNGIMVAGNNHLFDGFELESTMSRSVGGDDAFAIKAIDAQTGGIVIRNGLVRGYTAIASFGSEIGTPERAGNRRGAVRNVSVSNVRADRCQCLAYFKPGALVYDWRDGLVEDVELSDLSLVDAAGFLFVSGVMITAGRGAVIRGVTGRNLEVRARARSQGQLPTSAVDITLADHGRPAAIEDVDLQLAFVDPHGGARHGPGAPGYPIDHAVRIEKLNPGSGSMSGISLDISATGTRFGGIYVGPGLDDAVTIRRARLQRVATDPPAWMGGGGVWSDSRLRLQDVQIEALNNQLYSGRAFGNRRP